MEYIHNWLSGLNIGPVTLDSKSLDDTTKARKLRTYIEFSFPDGIDDQGPWFRGNCVVNIVCRDKDVLIADIPTLSKACNKFLDEFDHKDADAGIDCIDVEYVDFFSDGVGNHMFQYVFDVFARKG